MFKPRAGVLTFALLMCGFAPAQERAAISGTIANSSGAVAPNAAVSVTGVATGQTVTARADASGHYAVPNLAPGDYDVSANADGLASKTSRVTLAAGANRSLDFALGAASGNAPPVGLGDLGFTPEQTKGNADEQARLDKRSHMLKIHQRLGLITIAPMIATLVTANGAAGRRSSDSGRQLHAALGSVTAGMYLTTASFAIFAPKIPGAQVRGPIRLHRALAWIHGPGMILTPILGALAYQQRSQGQKVHGIAQAHGAVAAVTAVAFGLAVLSVTIHF